MCKPSYEKKYKTDIITNNVLIKQSITRKMYAMNYLSCVITLPVNINDTAISNTNITLALYVIINSCLTICSYNEGA